MRAKDFLKSAMVGILGNRLGATLLRPLWAGRATIFMLHRLSPDGAITDGNSIDSITKTIAALRRAGATFVSLASLVQLAAVGGEPAPGSVAFTIDDGYLDQGEMAEKAFIRNDCPVTVFAISGLIDGLLWPWDDQLAYAIRQTQKSCIRIPSIGREFVLRNSESRRTIIDAIQRACKAVQWKQAENILDEVWSETEIVPPQDAPPGYEPLNWNEARRLEDIGVDFAPHSVSHRIISMLPDEEAFLEISNSWRRLSQELTRPVPVFAWPTGRPQDFTERDMRFAESVGMLGAVSASQNYADLRPSLANPMGRFALNRFSMNPNAADNVQCGTAIERVKQIFRSER